VRKVFIFLSQILPLFSFPPFSCLKEVRMSSFFKYLYNLPASIYTAAMAPNIFARLSRGLSSSSAKSESPKVTPEENAADQKLLENAIHVCSGTLKVTSY
jgi:hypothetical protein